MPYDSPDSTATVCPLCGGGKSHHLLALGRADGLERAACRCDACDFVYMAPRLTYDFLNDYYGSAVVYAYGSDNSADYEAVIADKMGLIKKFVALAGNAPKAGLAVDYGAGAGSTVKALSNLGFDAVGVEISAKSRAAATALFGIDVRDGDLEQFGEDSIALLTMFDVMEHLLDPLAFARQLHTRIQPGGLVMIGVPNFDSLDRMVRGVNSQVMVFPEHVNHFTKSSLTRLMEAAGFDVRYIGSPPPYGVAISLRLRRAVIKVFGRNAATRAVSSILARIKRYLVYPFLI